MRTEFFRIPAILFSALWVGACGHMGRIEADYSGPPADESVVVLKVAPDTAYVFLYAGGMVGDRFNPVGEVPVVSGVPKDGYIVGRAKAGTVLGVRSVTMLSTPTDYFGTLFVACDDAPTMVFEVPRGQVAYLGGVTYKRVESKLQIEYSSDLQGAEAHMRRHFPKLRPGLSPVPLKLVRTSVKCGGGLNVIPIYIHRG